jgi:zinc/manganese transport system permease protein
MFNLPPSFPIVTIACAIWSAAWVTGRRRRVAAQAMDQPGSGPPDATAPTRPTSVPAEL